MKWWQNSIVLPRRQPATFNNRSLRAGSFRRRLFAEVTRFDIVTIEVEHERSVVIVAVLAPKPRRPIILRAGFERRGMELMHGLFAWGAQRDMNRLHRLRLSHDPKAGVSALEKARRVAREVAPQHIVERLQRFEIKLLGFFIIADWNGYVFNHAPNI